MISSVEASILAFVLLAIFLVIDIPIAVALAGVGIIVLFLLQGSIGLQSIGMLVWQGLDHFVLIAIPLFIFMGNILIYSGLGSELMDTFSKWTSRIPNGLGIATVFSCTVFAAMSGSSSASCALIGGTAIPEMRKRGYSYRMACGTVAAAGTLAILIPPSNEMIQYSVVSELSVGALFMAGLFPGLVLSALMALYLILYAKISPKISPPPYSISWRERFASTRKIWPAALLIVGVLGTIYAGIATPTEAAGIGAFLAWLLVVGYYKTFAWSKMWEALLRTVEISVMIFMIIAAASIFGYVLTIIKFPQAFAAWMLAISVSKWVILIIICAMFLVAGCFLSVTAITFVIVPLVLPIVTALNLDPLVFAITYTILAETGLITPPVGVNLFVIKGITKEARMVEDIAAGAAPFLVVMLLTIVIIWIFPQLVLWLPSMGR